MPESFGNLTRLKYVGLGINPFSAFPAELCGLPEITGLKLEVNTIPNLDTCNFDTDLQKLESLDLFATISDFNWKILALPNLEFVNMFTTATKMSSVLNITDISNITYRNDKGYSNEFFENLNTNVQLLMQVL